MDSINRTLYLPLYGKAWVSRRGLFLEDRQTEAIWDKASSAIGLSRSARSGWLACFLGMRAAVFDRRLLQKMDQHKDAVILHIG